MTPGLRHGFCPLRQDDDRCPGTLKGALSGESDLHLHEEAPMTSHQKLRVLLLENIHHAAAESFEAHGCSVETVEGALDEDELLRRIGDIDVLGIRSKTKVTARVVAASERLMAVGAYCIGTNQIALDACTERGVIAFNAPFSNTRSVVELAVGEIVMLLRRVPQIDRNMHRGVWNKTATNSYEVRGKALGIVGYGNIGAQLSVLAEAMGMRVYYYDVVEKLALGNAVKCASLEELLRIADVVSLHVDGRPENRSIFGEREFDLMKPGAVFLNLSRGFVVDTDALAERLRSGRLLGAAVDVYPDEPKSNDTPFESSLQGLENVILTSHIGGSTEEAQENIARYVPGRIVDYIRTGNTYGSVNFPIVQLPELSNAHRLLHIHRNVPGIIAHVNEVLAAHQVNIEGQYLKTNETIGYVITDINREYDAAVLREVAAVPNTIRFRVLY
ncbi:MAG: phosphoglycerate dehydrogenase [Chitinivibrionales bacterium]|nr:phosphoglycerate dehydrogenase [Chitinivibrionales bacterium]